MICYVLVQRKLTGSCLVFHLTLPSPQKKYRKKQYLKREQKQTKGTKKGGGTKSDRL